MASGHGRSASASVLRSVRFSTRHACPQGRRAPGPSFAFLPFYRGVPKTQAERGAGELLGGICSERRSRSTAWSRSPASRNDRAKPPSSSSPAPRGAGARAVRPSRCGAPGPIPRPSPETESDAETDTNSDTDTDTDTDSDADAEADAVADAETATDAGRDPNAEDAERR